MQRKYPIGARRLCLESLESRQLMAGVVTVQVTGGDLRITGDGSANGILVFQLGEGQYRVVGTNHGGSLTRVRLGNSLAPYQTVTGVNEDAFMDLRGGNDLLRFSHTPAYSTYSNIPEDLTIFTGGGDDEVYLSRLTVGDDVFVDLGSQSDTFEMINSIVGRDDGAATHNVDVFGQAGIDSIRMYREGGEMLVRGDVLFDAGTTNEQDNILLTLSHVLDDVTVRTHGGGDYVTIRSAQVDDVLTVETGNGDTAWSCL